MPDDPIVAPGALLRQQTILARFGEFALRADSLDDILHEACRLVSDALGTELAKVLELQPDGRSLLVRAGVGWKPGVVGRVVVAADERSSEGHALETGEAVVSTDAATERRFTLPDFLHENGVRALVNVVILGGRDRPPYGVLEVDSRRPRAFGDGDIAFLRGYANLLAAAVDRFRVLTESRDSEARLHAVLEAAPVGILVCEAPSGRIVRGNPMAERVFRHPILSTPDVASYENWVAYHADGRRLEAREYPLARALSGEERPTLEVQYQFGDGARGWVLLTAAPIRDAAGGITGAIVAAQDIDQQKRTGDRLEESRTELAARAQESARELVRSNRDLVAEIGSRQAAEGMVRQLQKMEAVGQLTGGIAHDFNNMLAVVMSGLSLVQSRLARGDTDVDRFVSAAQDGAMRAAALTQRLLAFSRKQALSPAPLDANRLLTGMVDLLHRTLGETVQVETVLAAGLWLTHADPGQLENAVLNLAVNARDAMEGGGRLTVQTANVRLDDAYARENHDVVAGQYVMVAVSDTGCGMTPAVMARVFDPYFTTKAIGKGTGLGLSQVYGFVKQSGGHIQVYSEPGRGTAIKIYLPRFYGEAVVAAREAVPAAPSGTRDRLILVVEDQARVREMSVASIRELGYTAIHADNGVAALRQLDEHPAIALLFTDVVMPDMTGRQLAEEALRRQPDLKILYTTGYTQDAVVHNGVLEPGVRLLPKPFTLENLARKLQEVLGAPCPTAPPAR